MVSCWLLRGSCIRLRYKCGGWVFAVRYLVGLLFLGLVASACSSGSDPEGPETSTTSAATETSVAAETTVVESLTGLENELDGEPPSTTVSADPDEQAAADVAHWWVQTWILCIENVATCDTNQFKKTSNDEVTTNIQTLIQGFRDRNESFLPAVLPYEYRVVWARKSATNPDVVGVLDCQRSYLTRVDDQGNTVFNGNYDVGLLLRRFERSGDGKFKLTNDEIIDEFTPEGKGGDECSTYNGTEVDNQFINDFLG